MTTTPAYPSAPPFPHQATHNIGQAGATAGPDEAGTVTMIRDGLHELQLAADKYVARYSPSGVSRGGVVALHGEHGAGKTHAIWFTMQQLAARMPSFADAPKAGSLCQLYAKVDGPDPVQLYRSLLGQLGLPELRELSRTFQAVVAAEQGVGEADQEERTAVKRRLREQPDVVDDIFGSYRLEPGAVREGGAQEIERIGDAWRDFERAVTALRRSKLARVAHRWIRAESLADTELERLGVSGPIADPATALLGLRIVARLFRRAEIPLAIFIDQIEGLVIGERGEESAANLGLLRSMIELLPQEGALVVVAGNLEAWRAYPKDIRQRFADGPLFLPALTEAEAAELIVTYQAPFKPPAQDPAEALYPFTLEAVPELLRYGGGNVRRFLQSCSLAFNEAFPEHREIDAAAVRSALQRASDTLFDRAGVLVRARQLLHERGLPVEENVVIGGVTVDLAVTGADGRPAAVVKLNEAIFRAQEAQDVRDSLELVRAAKAEGDVVHVLLIVLGYVSPDMTRILEEVADDTIVYSVDGFEEAFKAALSRVPSSAVPRSQAADPGALGERIEELQKALIDVLERRRDDDERMQAQIDALVRRQEEERAQIGRNEARKTWLSERSRLEREIREVRTRRAESESEDLERLRKSADASRDVHIRRGIAAAAVAAVFLLVLIIDLAAAGGKGAAGLVVPVVAVLLGGVGAVIGWRDLQMVRRLCPPEMRELTQPVASEEELFQIAAKFPGTPPEMLRSTYPGLRYAAALACTGGDARTAEVLAVALPRERSTIVRRAIARSLGTADIVTRDFYETHELVGVPEVVYIADITRSDVTMETSRTFAAVRALRAHDDRTFLHIVLQRGIDDLTIMKLAEGHRRGAERIGATMLTDLVPERSRRNALETLTPFDPPGLGTFDRLETVHQIDAWYLFFREMQWYSELALGDWQQ